MDRKYLLNANFYQLYMSVFDPLGFLTPLTINSRIYSCKISGYKSNRMGRKITREFLQRKKWLNDFEKVKNCRVSRCYQIKHLQQNKAKLHVFCNASSKVYTAIAYRRFLLPNNSFLHRVYYV